MCRLLRTGIGLAVIQQATGINTVDYCAPTILEQSGLGALASLVATVAGSLRAAQPHCAPTCRTRGIA